MGSPVNMTDRDRFIAQIAGTVASGLLARAEHGFKSPAELALEAVEIGAEIVRTLERGRGGEGGAW